VSNNSAGSHITVERSHADILTNDACHHYGESVNCLLPCWIVQLFPHYELLLDFPSLDLLLKNVGPPLHSQSIILSLEASLTISLARMSGSVIYNTQCDILMHQILKLIKFTNQTGSDAFLSIRKLTISIPQQISALNFFHATVCVQIHRLTKYCLLWLSVKS
jgi:hypothetical protein